MHEIDATIAFLEELANTLDRWARESSGGGWSTHQVDANRREADRCRRRSMELKAFSRRAAIQLR